MPLATSPGRQLPPDGEPSKPEDRQRQRLILALVLFLSAIGVVVYKVTTSVTTSQEVLEASLPAPTAMPPANPVSTETAAVRATTNPNAPVAPSSNLPSPESAVPKAQHANKTPLVAKNSAPANVNAMALAPTIARKVLPPLAVEVFAGGRPVPLQSKPTVAVHVDTSNGIQGRAAVPGSDTPVAGGDSSGPGRVRISPEALQVLSHPVDPNYPLLAREMKVQGSVILDAFIGRDGSIQALKIVSGPTILATAAMEAVRQWRFKPYLQAGQAVETEARITVNFTISTT